MIKLILLFKKREDLSTDDFLRHWREIHVPLVVKVPGIRRYVISPVVGSPSAQMDYDGMAELWFASLASAEAALATEETLRTSIDARNFIQRGSIRRFFVEEEIVIK